MSTKVKVLVRLMLAIGFILIPLAAYRVMALEVALAAPPRAGWEVCEIDPNIPWPQGYTKVAPPKGYNEVCHEEKPTFFNLDAAPPAAKLAAISSAESTFALYTLAMIIVLAANKIRAAGFTIIVRKSPS